MPDKIIPAPNVPPFVTFVTSTVPMVFDNSMSYYEALCALWKWLQDDVINVINNNAKVTDDYIKLTNEFIEKFNELKTYVDTYFDNLDVQEEINNKLDEMADDGTLQTIITQYIQANVAWVFDSVADMKLSENLAAGSYAQTLGFYAADDGGGGIYMISDSGTANEMNVIAVGDLYATLVTNEANPLQFGAYGDDTHDDTAALQACANYAETKSLTFHVPNKTFLTDTITVNNVKFVNIEGTIHLSSNLQSLNVYENVNGDTPSIFINKVTIGSIIMKGLNNASVEIQNAVKLRLVADNTAGHNFIGYTNFKLGFIRTLELEDDNSGTKWINENYFEGGRFLEVTIGAGSSGYPHQNNIFMEPMCEHTTWNFVKAYGNRVVKARLEGTIVVNFSADAMGNTIERDFGDTLQAYYYPKFESIEIASNITVNDLSNGQNYILGNPKLNEKKVISINMLNNPQNVALNGFNLKPGKNVNVFTSKKIPLPDKQFCIFVKSDQLGYLFRLRCYDATGTQVSAINTPLIKNSPVIAKTTTWTYGNAVTTRDNYWAIIVPDNPDIKMVDITLATPNTNEAADYEFAYFDVYVTSYANIPSVVYEGLGTQA